MWSPRVIQKQKYGRVARFEIEQKATLFDRQAEQKNGHTEAERVLKIHQ
jgi:hypothetical protein